MSWKVQCFLAVTFVTLFSTVYSQDLPEITKIILPDIKRQGLTGYLNCTVTRQFNNVLYWIHKSTNTIISANDKIDIDDELNVKLDGWPKYAVEANPDGSDHTTYTLIVRRLQELDSGTYTCQVVVKGEDQTSASEQIVISKDGEIIVLVPPTIYQSQTTQTVNIQEGRSVKLTCGASGYPTPNITWVRPNGKRLPTKDVISFRGNVLELKNVKPGDHGVYRCVADNAVRPPATYDATLYIDHTPVSRSVQSTYGQAANRQFDLTIECIVEGYPEPELQWYQMVDGGKKVIQDDDEHSVNVFESHGQTLSFSAFWFQLKIVNVQANDFGEYICEGRNNFGSHGASIMVYETSECQGPDCPPGDKEGSPTDIGSDVPLLQPLHSMLLLLISLYIAL